MAENLFQFAHFHRTIYFYVAIFSFVYGFLVYRSRQRVYKKPLDWNTLCYLYGLVGFISLLVTLVIAYILMAVGMVQSYYRGASFNCSHGFTVADNGANIEQQLGKVLWNLVFVEYGQNDVGDDDDDDD
ncbi:uncharacterized protein Dwil_GK19072 [Drosophila willistoni]|uniref:Uncharacterized protein n=1 Tax=Drosophila willistoni TaxID=7260 RepID=B4MWW3_DROWI|nr:uncharacterized protein Dwil_GK19072 [Drosophila willistoni]